MAEIEALRRQRMTGPQIARTLGMARSTVGLILRRLGLGRLALLDPKPPIVRYERDRPGEMIHLDIKKLGRINGVGHCFTGRGPGTHDLGRGWDFLHVCVDDASRLAYTELLPSEGQHDTIAFLQRAVAWLADHGVAVERVMTDNGSAYRSKLFAEALGQAAHATSEPGPIRLAPTAGPRASSRPHCANGPTPDPMARQTNAPPPSNLGPTTTT